MDLNKISSLIKTKRKELGITQEELAAKLFVTEKAVSRWENGRGTPDISLLFPLAKELNIDVSELLNGEEKEKSPFSFKKIKFVAFLYIVSILLFLIYLKVEYNPNIGLDYFVQLLIVVLASMLVVVGNKIYENNYEEKIEDKNKVKFLSQSIVFFYYVILLFNMVAFARYNSHYGYNLVPFKTIIEICSTGTFYSIVINIFGNLFIFMPLEFFLIELFKIKNKILNLVVSFLILFLIEICQFIFKIGVFDVDDIILCILGMILFYLGYSAFCERS